ARLAAGTPAWRNKHCRVRSIRRRLACTVPSRTRSFWTAASVSRKGLARAADAIHERHPLRATRPAYAISDWHRSFRATAWRGRRRRWRPAHAVSNRHSPFRAAVLGPACAVFTKPHAFRAAAVIDAHVLAAAAGRLTSIVHHGLPLGAIHWRSRQNAAAVSAGARRRQNNSPVDLGRAARHPSLHDDKARRTLRRFAVPGLSRVGVNLGRPAIQRRWNALAADARITGRTATIDAAAVREFRAGRTREPGPANAIDVELAGRAYDRGRYHRQQQAALRAH